MTTLCARRALQGNHQGSLVVLLGLAACAAPPRWEQLLAVERVALAPGGQREVTVQQSNELGRAVRSWEARARLVGLSL
jgi:hypothetical protein